MANKGRNPHVNAAAPLPAGAAICIQCVAPTTLCHLLSVLLNPADSEIREELCAFHSRLEPPSRHLLIQTGPLSLVASVDSGPIARSEVYYCREPLLVVMSATTLCS